MKIVINYDLIEKIREAKTGFTLKKIKNTVLLQTSFLALVEAPIIFSIAENPMIQLLTNSLEGLGIYTVLNLFFNILFRSFQKEKSLNDLRELSLCLKKIYVFTDEELLLRSHEYLTKYKFYFNDKKIPYLKQIKYINVLVYKNGEEKEISLAQEHVIGTKDYELSYGSPQKALKLAYNPI